MRDRIIKLYEGKVGPNPTDEELTEVFNKGKDRYENEIPPGYKDLEKGKGGKRADYRRAYGDYLMWAAIVEKAKTDGCDVIIVTDDGKEDWWKKESGQVIGPRPELLAEFTNETSKDVAIYSPDRFMEFAKEYLNANVSDDAFGEVRAASEETATWESETDIAAALRAISDQTDTSPMTIAPTKSAKLSSE